MKKVAVGSIYLTTDEELGCMYPGSLLKDRLVIVTGFDYITYFIKVRRIFSIKDKPIPKYVILNNEKVKKPSYIDIKENYAIPRTLRKKIAKPNNKDIRTIKWMNKRNKK